MEEERDRKKNIEVVEKIEVIIMYTQEARVMDTGEEAMITAGREVDLEVAARRLLAKESLL